METINEPFNLSDRKNHAAYVIAHVLNRFKDRKELLEDQLADEHSFPPNKESRRLMSDLQETELSITDLTTAIGTLLPDIEISDSAN